MLMARTPSPCQTHSLYMNVIEKIFWKELFIVVKTYHHLHMYTHTQRKYHCIFTETPHTQCNQASSQLVHSRTPWKPPWSSAASRSSTKPPRAGSWAAQKRVPSCCPPWAQEFSALITALVLWGGSAVLLQGHEGWAVPQTLTAPGLPVERGLCLRTSGHSVQQHHNSSCCLALFGFQWFICISLTDVWLWYPSPATQGKKVLHQWSSEVLQDTQGIALKYSVV